MITYDRLAARPSALQSLSGLTLADFEALYQDFAAAYAQDRRPSLTRTGQPRKRAAGSPASARRGAARSSPTMGAPAC